MILSNQYLKDTTIIFNTKEDLLEACKLTNCTLISPYYLLSILTTIIDRPQDQPFKRLKKPENTYGVVMGCYIRDCVLPDAFYDESNHFRSSEETQDKLTNGDKR